MGAVLVATCFPAHRVELELLARYRREDEVDGDGDGVDGDEVDGDGEPSGAKGRPGG
jgi:hypothetical protein